MIGILALAIQMIDDQLLTVGGGVETVLLGIKNIEFDAGDVEAFTGVRLIIADNGEVGAQKLTDISDIPGGVQPFAVDVVHHALKIQLIVALINKTGETFKMVGVSVGQEPAVDDHLFTLAFTGQFLQECHEAIAGSVVPLLDTAAIVNEQAVVGHPNDDQSTAVDLAGIVMGVAGVDAVAVFRHGKTVHDDHGLGGFTGGAFIRKTIGIDAGHIRVGVNGNTDFLQLVEDVNIDRVRAIGGLIPGVCHGSGAVTDAAILTVRINCCIAGVLSQCGAIALEVAVIRINGDLQVGPIGAAGHNSIATVIFQPCGNCAVRITQGIERGRLKRWRRRGQTGAVGLNPFRHSSVGGVCNERK